MSNQIKYVKNIKIGFCPMGGDKWIFGVIYLSDLFRALRESFAEDVKICLLTSDIEKNTYKTLEKLVDEVLVWNPYSKWTVLWAIRGGIRRLFRQDLVRSFMLKRNGVNVIWRSKGHPAFDVFALGSNMPTLGWFPDFQHRHLPEMFNDAAIRARNAHVLRIAKYSTRVILLSESVKHDFETFLPKYVNKARVILPVTYIPESVYKNDPEFVCDLYHLPKKFIFLPNQFWKHKNHKVVFRALRILKERGIEVFLVCSGYPWDSRHSYYLADIFQEISQWGIRNQVAYIGMLSRDQVFMLMRQSICVLNPSFFEGYGMTVNEARSVGKQLLLSDIPAHREQNPPQAVFFDPRNCEDLARKMERIWREKLPGPDRELEAEAYNSFSERIHNYAKCFMSVVEEIANT